MKIKEYHPQGNLQKVASNSHVLRIEAKKVPLLLISDVHFDSLKCDRESLKAHMEQIKKENGKILIIGDLFDVMGTFQDPRSKPDQVRREYYQKGRSYLDLVIEDAYEFLKPYRENLALIGYGNHETNIMKRHDTDPIDRLIFLLNMEGHNVAKGAYQGFFTVIMRRPSSTSMTSFKIAYHHGFGGAQRSKGVLNSQLMARNFPDADLIISGHDHNKIYDPSNVCIRLNKNLEPYQTTQHWVKLGSYKKSSTDMGYEVEKGYNPSRTGGWFCDLNLKRVTPKGVESIWIEPDIREARPSYGELTHINTLND